MTGLSHKKPSWRQKIVDWLSNCLTFTSTMLVFVGLYQNKFTSHYLEPLYESNSVVAVFCTPLIGMYNLVNLGSMAQSPEHFLLFNRIFRINNPSFADKLSSAQSKAHCPSLAHCFLLFFLGGALTSVWCKRQDDPTTELCHYFRRLPFREMK